ncbi:MAG: hypothetical protein IH613_13195 [Desulfuromonadales bacterium]|nr:hypothetical protein [Desulfuromonadales bacterium]
MSLIPTPDTIPTSWGYFQFFLLLTFPLHLLLMNSLLGSSFIAVYAHIKGDRQARALAYELAKVLPLLIALTVNLGVAPLLFLQVLYGQFIYASSVLMGLFWILIIPTLIIAYYATYWYDFKFASLGRAGILVLGFACLCFLVIGFMFSNNMTMMLHPENWSGYFDNSSGTLLNTGDATLWPRYLHFMIGGTAVGGLFVALYGRFLTRREQQLGDYASAIGMKVFRMLTIVQIGIGIWFLLALPKAQMLLFMGGNGLATSCFLAALLLIAMVLVAAFRSKVYATAGLLAGLIYLMAFMRDFVRGGYLRDHFSPGMLEVVPEYSPLVLFLGTLVIGLLLIAWMVRAAFTRCVD